jgi:Zn-dependent protease
MFSRAVRLVRIRGIDVRLDPTLVLIALLVGWTFGTRFATVHPLGTAITMAAAGATLFFVSILAHELAHAFEAMHRGIEVRGITLFLFGGVTEMDASSETPRDEFVIAAVGPYVSLLCGAAFGLLATYASWLFPPAFATPVADVAGLLGWLNVLLAVFNLVPGAPLDGGRVLRGRAVVAAQGPAAGPADLRAGGPGPRRSARRLRRVRDLGAGHRGPRRRGSGGS